MARWSNPVGRFPQAYIYLLMKHVNTEYVLEKCEPLWLRNKIRRGEREQIRGSNPVLASMDKEAKPMVDWGVMGLERKIEHLMWRFVMHPAYDDSHEWTFKLEYKLREKCYHAMVVRWDNAHKGQAIKHDWRETAHEVLDVLMEEIEGEIE